MTADRAPAARLETLVRACIECGLCLPHCATFLATVDETHSPRGRLLLLREVLAGRLESTATGVGDAFDQCLGCLACVSACPSGIDEKLLDALRDHAPTNVVTVGGVPAIWLDRAPVLKALRRVGNLGRGLVRGLLGPRWRRRLDAGPTPVRRLGRWLGTLPRAPGRDADLVAMIDRLLGEREPQPVAIGGGETSVLPHAGTAGPRVTWFSGCANGALLDATSRRLQDLLRASGYRIEVPGAQSCCGALASHTGRRARAQELRDRNERAFQPLIADCDHIVVEAAGCGRELKRRYPAEWAARVIDAVVLLEGTNLPELGPVPLTVAVHDPCHASHGQGIIDEPRRLLQRIPQLQLVEPAESDVCCGSAGAYALAHPDLSAAMGRRKAEQLAATGCDLVVTSNPGCLGQIADALQVVAPTIPVLPLTDLVWLAWRRSGGSSLS